MKVILQRDVPKVGKGGDIVTVADGYARNYLLPRSYAVPATGGAMKEHTARADREKQRSASQLTRAETDASKLRGLSLTIIGKVAAGSTKLYGSITAQDVAERIEKETGIAVDKRRVGLVDPIKTLGDYRVPVRLHNDVTVPVGVAVVTEEELERRKAQAAAAEAAAAQAAEAAAAKAAAEAPAPEPAAEPVVVAEASMATTAEADTGEAAEGAEAESAGEPAE